MGEGGVKVIAGPGNKISNIKRQQDNELECLLYWPEEMLSGKAFHRDVFHSALYLHFPTCS